MRVISLLVVIGVRRAQPLHAVTGLSGGAKESPEPVVCDNHSQDNKRAEKRKNQQQRNDKWRATAAKDSQERATAATVDKHKKIIKSGPQRPEGGFKNGPQWPGKGLLCWLCWLCCLPGVFALPNSSLLVSHDYDLYSVSTGPYEGPHGCTAPTLPPWEFAALVPPQQLLQPQHCQQQQPEVQPRSLSFAAVGALCLWSQDEVQGQGLPTVQGYHDEFDEFKIEPVENSLYRLGWLFCMGLFGFTCFPFNYPKRMQQKKAGQRRKRRSPSFRVLSDPLRRKLPVRWAGKARMCGRQRVPKPRNRFRNQCFKWRQNIRRRSWKIGLKRRGKPTCSTVLLDLSPYGPAWYRTMYTEAGYDGFDPSYLQKVSDSLEGGAAGAARTRRHRKKQSGSLGNETNNLLRALKECLNQGGNPQVQQLAQLLSSVLLPNDSGQKPVSRQSKPTKEFQYWKGHKYEVDSANGWWTWIGPADQAVKETPPLAASRQVVVQDKPKKASVAPDSDGSHRSYHKITFLRTSDWAPSVAPNLVSFGKLEQDLKLGHAPSGNLVEIWDPGHLEDLLCLWNAFGDPGPLTVLGTCDLSAVGGHATQVSISRGRFGSKLEPVWLKKVGAKEGPWVFTPTKVLKDKLPQTDKVQIRIIAPSHFRDQFLPDEAMNDSPTCVITQLASVHGLKASDLLGGNWSNQTQGQVQKLVGYLRVRKEVSLKLLKGSGTRAIFTTKVGDRSGPAVFWHRKEAKENASTYFRRISAIAAARSEPLLWRSGGGHELGLAKTPEDLYENAKRAVSIQGIPRSWDPLDISTFFHNQGWENVEVSHRHRGAWVAHGTPPQAQQKQAHWSFLVQDDVPWHINVQAWAARTKANIAVQIKGPSLKRSHGELKAGPLEGPKPPNGSQPADLPRRGRTATRQQSSGLTEKERSRSQHGEGKSTNGSQEPRLKQTRSQVAPTQLDPSSPADVEMKDGEAKVTETKVTVGAPSLIDAAEAQKAGWSQVDLGGCGDCFFRAAAGAQAWNSKAQLLTSEAAKSKGAWLRNLTVKHLKKEKQRYSKVWVPPESGPLAGLDFDAWLDEAAKQATFANGIIIQAFTEISGCPVIIWHDKTHTKQKVWDRLTLAGRFSTQGLACSSKEGSPLVLLLKDKHYTMLQQPQDQSIPKNWLKDSGTSIIDVDLEGAGKASSCGSLAAPSLHSFVSPASSSSCHPAPPLQPCAQVSEVVSPRSSRSLSARARSLPSAPASSVAPPSLCSPSPSSGSGRKRSVGVLSVPPLAGQSRRSRVPSAASRVVPRPLASSCASAPPAPSVYSPSACLPSARSGPLVSAFSSGVRTRLRSKQPAPKNWTHTIPDEDDLLHMLPEGIPVNPKNVANARGLAQLLNSGQEDRVWTCPLCQVRLFGKGKRLSSQRSHHLHDRHPTVDPRTIYNLKNTANHVQVSFDLPQQLQGWTCPWCPAALPQGLSRYVLSAARQKHYKEAHKRLKITAGKVVKTRARQARADPTKDLYHAARRQEKSQAVSTKLARKELDYKNVGGHDIQVLRPHWATWPTTSKKLRAGTLLTCCACWRASNADWDQPCVGRGGTLKHSQRALWQRLIACNSSDNIDLLLATWKVSRAEADVRFGVHTNPAEREASKRAKSRCGGYRNTRVGEASNPGPRSSQPEACSQFNVISLNCQSPNGAWGLFEDCKEDESPLVIALQETRFSAQEELAFARYVRKFGFHIHVSPGLPDQGNRPRGGVLWLVDKRLRCRRSVASASEDSQVAAVFVEDWMLLNFYAPPDRSGDPQLQVAEQLQHALIAEDLPAQWLAVGDANECPQSSYISNTLAGFQGRVIEQGCPSRWEGQEELDWVQTPLPNKLLDVHFGSSHYSDHKALKFQVSCAARNSKGGFFKQRPDWIKPAAATVPWWRDTLAVAWQESSRFQPGFEPRHDVDLDWEDFLCDLENCFWLAFQKAHDNGFATSLELSKALRSKGAKGRKPQWKQRCLPRLGPVGQGSMPLRKLRRRVAQLYELKRHLLRPQISALQRKEAQQLAKRLGLQPTGADPVSLRQVLQELDVSKAQLYSDQASARQTRFAAWKQHMETNPRALGQWLRCREQVAVTGVQSPQGLCETPQTIVVAIKNFWDSFWSSHQTVDPELITQRLIQHAHVPTQPIHWDPPDLDLLTAVVRKADGSGGGDGFVGKELCHLPIEAIKTFRSLALEWERLGQTPAVFNHTRMVNFGKPGKVSAEGHLPIEACRPISVLSVFWRLWGSAWLQTESAQAWIRSLPTSVVAGKGSDSLTTAASIFAELSQKHFAATLDFTKCYDLMIPKGTAELLRAGGWPSGLTEAINHLWSSQERWIIWQNHVHSETLRAGSSVPQGCPFGPLALAAWMASGVTATADDRVTPKVFMDDRTLIASEPAALVDNVQRWETWSQEVGLKESSDKLQLTATSPAFRRELQQLALDPAKVQPEFEVLGCCAQVVRRQNSAKETKRLLAANQALQLIGNIQWPFETFLRAAQSHALSKATYGWVARLPPQTSLWKCWAQVRRAQKCHKAANKHLRAIVYGGNSHLDMLIGASLIRVVARLITGQGVQWSHREVRGNPLATLHHWLTDHGYAASGPWVWDSDHPTFKVDLLQMPVKAAQHAARQGWRWCQWQQFLWGPRHEVEEVSSLDVNVFACINWDEMRKFSKEPAFRAIVTGAFMSPSAMSHRHDNCPTVCPWCQSCLGHWNHVFWECTSRPETIACPTQVVTARFGWGATAVEAAWMTKVAREIWDVRHLGGVG